MSDYQNQTPAKKTALDNTKLRLYGPPTKGGRAPQLFWTIKKNSPWIVVRTNDPEEAEDKRKGYGKINAQFDAPAFFGLISCLEQAIDAAPGFRAHVENKNYTFFNGKKSEKPEVVTTVYVGKNEEGVVWISVLAHNRPKIQFKFGVQDWHQFFKADGTPCSEAEMSVIYAKAYVSILRSIMNHLLVTEFEVIEYGKSGGFNRNGGGNGNNGGGYNRNQSSNSAGSSSSSSAGGDFDDDLPF